MERVGVGFDMKMPQSQNFKSTSFRRLSNCATSEKNKQNVQLQVLAQDPYHPLNVKG